MSSRIRLRMVGHFFALHATQRIALWIFWGDAELQTTHFSGKFHPICRAVCRKKQESIGISVRPQMTLN